MPISSFSAPSAIAKPGVCTSSTRPASPFDGQVIYETDTDKALVWNGSAWVYLSTGTANPVGLVYINNYTLSGGSTNLTSCFSSTFLNYKIVVDFTSVQSGYIRMQMLSGTTVAPSAYSSVGAFSYLSAGTQFNDNIGTGNQGVGSAIVGVSGGAGGIAETSIEVIAPFDSRATTGSFIGCGHLTNSGLQYTTGGFMHYSGGSYDGVILLAPSGSFTGTARVYGYRN